jgi:hypothetical protein
VLLVHRDQPHRWARTDGCFPYDVPEFYVAHRTVDKWFSMSLSELRNVDLVWWDEGKYRGGPHFYPPRGARTVPVAFYCIYPTLSESIYRDRQERARRDADLVLLEHDDLARWQGLGIPARRCAYSVDETHYRDPGHERTIDVGFFCVWNYSPERRALNDWLAAYCERRGWRFGTNGGNGSDDYPNLLARSKVIVHINRTPRTRPPRIFDASACGAAVLASRMPVVSGEEWIDGVHYAAFDQPTAEYHDEEFGAREPYADADCAQLADALDYLVGEGGWQGMARRAQEYVLMHHTWRVRARELRATLKEALKL